MNCKGQCSQGRKLCVTPHACELIQANSDGSDPHADTRDLLDMALDWMLPLLLLAMVIAVVFSAIGFWSA